jgi:benzoate-CoA ligase
MALSIPENFNIAGHFVDQPARRHPERPAIRGEPSAVRYDELARRVSQAGNALLRSGCAPGDRVLIVLPDSAEFYAAFFGAAKIGAIAVPVNPMTRSGDYATYLEDCGARFAVVHAMALAEFAAAQRGGRPERVIVVGEAGCALPGNGVAWSEWLRGAALSLDAHPTRSTDPAFILYTSGSGGTPKGAVHQHKDMLVTSECYARGVLHIQPSDICFSVSKLYFAYGLGNGMYFPLSAGASAVLMPERPRPERIAELLERHRPTLFFAVPTVYGLLLRAAEQGTPLNFASVRACVSAGEKLPPEVFEQFRRRFGLAILDAIGSTEMLHMFIATREGRARPGSCGVEVPHVEARIVDEDGQACADGEIGNLWVRGQAAFAEYWNRPDLTSAARRGDWVVTGDKFYRDPEGYYYYCGRADDMMKVSGLWVAPGEVENALLAHPAVAEAAVVASRDGQGLTRPVAFAVLRGEARASPPAAEEIMAFVRARLPQFKCPQEVKFLPELPKTATGKIQRFRLREWLR